MARPQPLLTQATIVGVLAGIATVAVALGLIDDEQSRTLVAAVGGLISLLAPLLAGLLAHGKVTPVDDPQKEINGRLVPLVPTDPTTI